MRRHREFMSPYPCDQPAPRRSEQPYLFAYDITQPKRARQVLKCLRRWRIDGQLSVHETFLSPYQAEDLATELLDYVDPRTDRLLLGRLSQRGGAPLFAITRTAPRPPILGQPVRALPVRLQAGCYLLAYDIRDDQRLRRVQQASSRVCVFLQRSVYLYYGGGGNLMRLLSELAALVLDEVDDVRLYALHSTADVWFLCGPKPPLANWGDDGRHEWRRPSSCLRFTMPWEAI